MFAGIEIDEQLHLLAHTLPDGALMKDDISLEEFQIRYFFELEGDLLLTLHSNII